MPWAPHLQTHLSCWACQEKQLRYEYFTKIKENALAANMPHWNLWHFNSPAYNRLKLQWSYTFTVCQTEWDRCLCQTVRYHIWYMSDLVNAWWIIAIWKANPQKTIPALSSALPYTPLSHLENSAKVKVMRVIMIITVFGPQQYRHETKNRILSQGTPRPPVEVSQGHRRFNQDSLTNVDFLQWQPRLYSGSSHPTAVTISEVCKRAHTQTSIVSAVQ